jgi:hypothetical protein
MLLDLLQMQFPCSMEAATVPEVGFIEEESSYVEVIQMVNATFSIWPVVKVNRFVFLMYCLFIGIFSHF